MPWVKVDDGFYSNPKVIKAGPLARSLYIAGLCHCATGLTDGAIDKAALPLLLAQTGAKAAAAKDLVAVGLWVEQGDAFEVKDYLHYNPSRDKATQERESARERKARQRAKGSKQVDQDNAGRFSSRQESRRDTPRDGHRESQGESPATRPVPSPLTTSSDNFKGVEPDVAGAEAPPEEGSPPNPDTTAEAAVAHMAACDLARAKADGTPIRNETSYLAKLTDTRRTSHLDQLTALASQSPTADPADLAERLDPSCGPLDGGTARAEARWRQTQAQLDAEAAQAEAHRAARARAKQLLDEQPELDADLTAKAQAEHPDARPSVVREHVIRLAIAHLEEPPAA